LEPDLLVESLFVGRAAEISELQDLLDSAVDGKGKTVFIQGEAGTGKTRLVKEFLKIVSKKELTTLVGWCLSNASITYFPFIEAFKNYDGKSINEIRETLLRKTRQELGIAAKALGKTIQGEERKQASKFSPKVWKDLTFASVSKTLQDLSKLKPILLFLMICSGLTQLPSLFCITSLGFSQLKKFSSPPHSEVKKSILIKKGNPIRSSIPCG
jgi:AAA+ ATPase superfamily predicted ATPase